VNRFLPLLAAALVVAATVLTVGFVTSSPRRPDGIALGREDRAELAAPPVLRGPDGPPVDPRVDLFDPEAAARAYLAAAHSAVPEDAGHTNRRATAYALPGSPPASVGVLVLDPPPPGTRREVSVRSLELVAVDPADTRRAYLADVLTTDGTGTQTRFGAHVVLAHQPDGRWLVTADTADDAETD